MTDVVARRRHGAGHRGVLAVEELKRLARGQAAEVLGCRVGKLRGEMASIVHDAQYSETRGYADCTSHRACSRKGCHTS